MSETLEENEMTDEEYEAWLAHYKWGTDVDLILGKRPKDIPVRVYRYWERQQKERENSDNPDD